VIASVWVDRLVESFDLHLSRTWLDKDQYQGPRGLREDVLLSQAAIADGVETLPTDTDSQGRATASGLRIIRATRIEEIDQIRDIAHEFHAESRYAHLPFSEEKFGRFCNNALRNPRDNIALYVQYRGRTVGVLTAGTGDYYLGEGGRMVTVYVMYVSASIRSSFLGGKVGVRLLRMVSDWARFLEAQELHIHSTSGFDAERTDRLLQRLGFKTYGGNYAISLGVRR